MPFDFSRMSIMIVEDNTEIRRLFVGVLETFGVGKIIQCGDGLEALEELKLGAVDVIFADWRMRPMGGLPLLREIRAGRAECDPFIPVIMLTSHGERASVEEARDAGATEFLVKPCPPKEIYARLASLVNRPRSFVKSPGFTGPDRRRRSEHRAGPDRRGDSHEV